MESDGAVHFTPTYSYGAMNFSATEFAFDFLTFVLEVGSHFENMMTKDGKC